MIKTMRVFKKEKSIFFEKLPPIDVFVVTFEVQRQLVVASDSELSKELEDYLGKKTKFLDESLLKARCCREITSKDLKISKVDKLGIRGKVY